ncbi:MAG: sensor histidine kinase [Cyanobacteriota bacterium]
MTLLAFLLGLSLGIGFWYWKQQQITDQLRQTLNVLPNAASGGATLSLIYRLRREFLRTHEQRQQLEEQLQTWEQLLEIAPIGYLQVDADNQLIACNRQAQTWLKIDRWQPGQVRLLLELVRSYELDQLIEETRRNEKPLTREWVFQTTIYSPNPLSETPPASRLRSAYAVPLKAFSYPLSQGRVCVFLENQQAVLQLSQSRDRAFSDLAHELRTPLTSIRLVAETLENRLNPPESRWAGQLLQETNRLIQFVQDCLEISHLEKDPSKHLKIELVELRELIFGAWYTLEPLAKQKRLRLDYSSSEEVYLKADPSRLTQVFLNLFDNSFKYSPPETAIHVEVKILDQSDVEHQNAIANSENLIKINIIDLGCGFSDADLPYVFDRLYRGDPSRQRQLTEENSETPLSTRGSGLGLSIVQQIILAHGGSIEAKNSPETGGAWLEILLPQSSLN